MNGLEFLRPGKRRKTTVSSPLQGTSGDPTSQSHPSPDSGPYQSLPSLSFPDGVKVLHDCLDATVDICFVHGLTGDRESTWTADGHSTPWPKSLLPEKLKKARILTYGYNAYIVRKSVASLNRLIDHAANLLNDLTTERASSDASSRSLIFVAHSLGGLVCKEAILLSRNSPETHLRGIFDYTIGIAFMGTPHRGSWMADWAKIPASALGHVKSINEPLLKILQTDSQILELIQVDFWSMIRDRQKASQPLEVTCFFEELPLPGFGAVVSKESATLEGYSSFSIHASHSNMVKFTTIEENGFKRLLGELVRWKSQVVQSYPETMPLTSDCLQSLAFPQMQSRSHDIDRAITGTCEWLLRHETYCRWAASDRGLLWIKGKPGSGKSTLLKYALENLGARDSAIVLSFFFHGRGNELQKTPLGLFRCLLHQVLKQAPNALLNLVNTFEIRRKEIGEPGKKWKWHPEELRRFFELSLQEVLKTRPVWLFIDALDESGKKNAISLVESYKLLLKSLPSSNGLKEFHICFACRPYLILYLDHEFEICPEKENRKDISTFVDDRLSAFCLRTSCDIPALIKQRATGVFMWAYLVVNRVLDLEREGIGLKKIEAVVYSIPLELDELYMGLIRTMSPASMKLIQWICFATKPLSIDELRWAMVIEADCPHRSLQAYESAEDYISDSDSMTRQVQTLSCGLAEVNHGQHVQFIHQSVKDFFIEKGLLTLDKSLRSIDIAIGMAHFRLSRICILYLMMEEISRSIRYSKSNFPFLRYATTSWVVHLKECDARGVPQEDLLELFAWLSNALIELWVHVYTEIAIHISGCPPRGTSLAHILSGHGISGLLIAILEREDQITIDIDAKDRDGQTPLSWAAAKGHYGTAKILLEKGADVKAKDENGQTPLLLAAGTGHEGIMKLLLENGANVKAKDKSGRTSLLLAAGKGHEGIMKLLLENGADVKAKDKGGRTSLSLAARNGHEGVVKVLLETDTDVEAKDICGWTLLLWASKGGHNGTVKLLLEKGSDVNAKDIDGWTPLLCAAEKGDEGVARLLLEKGADVNAKDIDGRTPLLLAAGTGHEGIMVLLLENGADVNAKDIDGRTPLFLAAGKGHEGIMMLLLENGADVNAKDIDGQTPLFLAAGEGHKGIIKLLLEKGTNVEAKGKDDLTPLWWAAENGHAGAVKLLLENGANVNSKGNGRLPLSRAAQKGYEDIVKLLSERGVSVRKSQSGHTPLSRAALHGYEVVVKLLLDTSKVDVDAQDRHGRTPLWWAAEKGRVGIVKLLLKKGADVEAKDIHSQTPLSRAAKHGHEAIVKLFKSAK